MPKHSQIFSDIIEQEKAITKKMQKVANKKQKEENQRKMAEKPKHSIVDEFAARHQKPITPAEKGAMTKAKKKAQKIWAEKKAREKAQMEAWTAKQKERKEILTEAYNKIGSRASSLR